MTLIKSFSVGNGDMFYIKHVTDNFTIIDCCMSASDKERIVSELIHQSAGKNIIRFISTHPDDDHIRGLDYLRKWINLPNFYCVKNNATKEDQTESFIEYCALRDSDNAYYISKECSRKWLNQGDETRSGSGLNILWPDTNNKIFKSELLETESGLSPNNISPIIRYQKAEGGSALWMGDLESWFMEAIADNLNLPQTDILFAPHHGRDSGKIPTSLLDLLKPRVIVVGEAPAKHLHYYPNFNTITQNSAGDIAIEFEANKIHFFVSNKNYSVKFLTDFKQLNRHGSYIGSLTV